MSKSSIMDQEEVVVNQGGQGLDLESGSYPFVLWGVISHDIVDFNDKTTVKPNAGKILVGQLPTELDDKKKPKVVWAFCTDSIGAKSKFGGYLKGIYGETIETSHYIRNEKGNIDPKKLYGKNCLVAIGDISKTEGEKKIGVIGFSPAYKGMQEFKIDETVEIPQILEDIKNGKYLHGNPDKPSTEAPTIPQGAQPQTPAAPQAPKVPEAPKTTRKAKAEPVAPVQQPAPVAPAVVQAPVTPAAPVKFKPEWRKIDGVQQTCSECGKKQFTRDPSIYGEGHWTCEKKHADAESKESLLNPVEDIPGDEGPEDADNIM